MSGARRAYDIARASFGQIWDRVQDIDARAASELDAPPASTPRSASAPGAPPELDAARAREYLGLGERPSVAEIQSAHDALARRADPERFLPGSEARGRAEEIRAKLSWARELLLKETDPTDRRFAELELD